MDVFVVINLTNFEISVCASKLQVADLTGMHRNSISSEKGRAVYGDYLVVRGTLDRIKRPGAGKKKEKED